MKKIAAVITLLFAFMLMSTTVFSADMKSEMSQIEQKAKTKATGSIDINSASKDQLKSLPAIGDTYSQKIIDNRPYQNKTQLKSKKVIPDAVYDKIKDLIVAKQPKK